MKKILLLLVFAVSIKVSAQVINYTEYENFLKKHVSNKGVVDYEKVLKNIESLGYKTIELDMSEFRKLDGGLSCLSLRF